MLTKPLQVRLEPDDHEELQKISKAEGLSVNWLIRRAVKEYVAREKRFANQAQLDQN